MSKLTETLFKNNQADAWLRRNIAQATSSPTHVIADLTPEVAAALLERNPHNRHVQEATVIRYARDMEQQLFDGMNGESIKISKCGYLNDGQHRCQAVIMSGRSIRTMFVFGLERESRKTLDCGATRTAGHYMSMDGIKNANNIAAMAKLVFMIERTGKIRGGIETPSKQEVMRFSAEHMEKLQTSFSAVHRKGANRVAALSLLGAAHYLMARIDPVDADLFIDAVIEGVGLQKYDPAWAARERLIAPNNRLNQNEQMNILFRCWNKYRAGEKVIQIYYSVHKGELLPALK